MLKFSKLFFIGFLIIFGLTGCSDDDTNPEPQTIIDPSESYQLLNVSYGNDSDQVYDIYLPPNRDLNTKVIVLVHGGGWTSGDKADMDDIKDRLLIDLPEYAIVNINYRLASQGVSPFPMQLNDITTVISELKTKQTDYTISQDYGFLGISAGAHLSMLWSYSYDTNNDVNMVGSIVGPTNFTDPAYSSIVNPAFLFFGVAPSVEFAEQYSPFHQVQTTSPPTILFYGGMDNLIPTSQGVDMDAKLTTLNVPHQFTLYPNEGHGWEGTNLLDTWTKLKAFVEIHH
ncbi:alpha/beta hydrolase [uncultured Lacinutrix sp.]|uniref:alpha/beta hydrolase n=1 Tax=uncultured Lacinutrix sp. TaxID=574032 RepID=UPI00260A2FE3|nr:alpha/beta hydrolase [uncultured Lacinutrix sp.]